MRRLMPLLLTLPALLLAGCGEGEGAYRLGSDGVKEFTIHIGWNDDLQSQYMTPSTITVQQGDKVRFLVINDDARTKDYNGPKSGNDNFHDVALDYPGACDRNPIEHEAPAGARTSTECSGKDFFVAHQKGTFRIICEVRTNPSHDALGMHATFTVEAA